MTYARARLWLGITGVGSQVVFAVVALALDWPGRFLDDDPAASLGVTLLALVPAAMAPVLLLLPLDVLGGTWAVRVRPPIGRWLAAWARGAGVQLGVWLAGALTLLGGARLDGARGAWVGGVVAMLVLLALRGRVARLVAPLDVLSPRSPAARTLAESARGAGLVVQGREGSAGVRLVVADVADESFVGGWAGIGARTLWVPARWAELPAAARGAQLARRRATAGRALGGRGLHAFGVLLALAWNALGLALALWGAGVDARSAAGVVTLVLLVVPWSFLGLLVLPTPSRRGVYAADALAARTAGAGAVRDAIERLDRWQDDEPARAAGVEAIFHPVPARAGRVARLAALGTLPSTAARRRRLPTLSAHHAARHALYLAWALGSPLSRAVHCNVGRPALWVFWPGD